MGHRGMARIALGHGDSVRVLGRAFAIEVAEEDRKTSVARLEGSTVVVRLARGQGRRKREVASDLARRCISMAVLQDVRERVSHINGRHFGFDFNRVSVKDSRTNWGSCNSRTGNLNLNFRLLFAPPGVFEYVVVHELAHLKVRNHSKEFWNEVYRALPDAKERKRWLRENGWTLGSKMAEARKAGQTALGDFPPLSGAF